MDGWWSGLNITDHRNITVLNSSHNIDTDGVRTVRVLYDVSSHYNDLGWNMFAMIITC